MIANNILTFSVIDEYREKKEVRVVREAGINFELVHLLWLIKGAELYETESMTIRAEMFKLLGKVSSAFVEISAGLIAIPQKGEEDPAIIPMRVTQKEASLLNMWLTARITHCSKERNNEKKFNIETFLGMRELRLSITEIFLETVI